MEISEFIAYLREKPGYRGQIVHMEHLPSRAARYGKLKRPLPEPLAAALRDRGIKRLYVHQVEAVNAVRESRDIIVSTATSSGKTLCYNIATLESWIRDPLTKALYLFPTKALAQDQLRTLQELTQDHLKGIRFGTYDGDTSRAARGRLRKSAAIILTNPDMLHTGILPNHGLWIPFLSHLKYVVIDEAHTYRGVFGSHVACVLRRLRRLCARYGTSPVFICCSATVANPGEHAERLIGLPVTVIDDDSSPRGAKRFALWNPPFIDRAKAARRSLNTEATMLFTELVRHELRNITFTKSRRVTELILRYAQDALRKKAPELVGRIASYRGGYQPEERRRIEKALFRGELLGVTATNALELGVDIGSLEATVHVGYPGTIASLWQQAGRAGRGERPSLSFLIGHDNPLDQYFMRHPRELFSRSHEHALIDPSNIYVLQKHLPCAAHEHPLTNDDEYLFGSGFPEAMALLERRGILKYREQRWFFPYREYPAQDVNIRSISANNFVLVDEGDNFRILEEVEETMAFFRIHQGAIYLHRGRTYLITHLDLDVRVAYARPTDPDYYTLPRELNEVRIIGSWKTMPLPTTTAHFGQVRVSQQVVGYRRIQQYTEEILGEEGLDLPRQSFETHALWFQVPRRIAGETVCRGLDFHGGLHAVEHAMIGMLPLFAMCDRMDIGGLSTPDHPDTGHPAIFVYDALPGGVGIAEQGFSLLPSLWRSTLSLIAECPCEGGCPSCIQSPKCGRNNEPLDKRAAIVILEQLLK